MNRNQKLFASKKEQVSKISLRNRILVTCTVPAISLIVSIITLFVVCSK